MKLNEFLEGVDFVHGYGENPEIVIRDRANILDIRLVERAVTSGPDGDKKAPIVIVVEER